MSIFSMFLGPFAAIWAVIAGGNLKGALNKPVESYNNTSFVSPALKKGFDIVDKSAKTAIPTLIAIQSFTGDSVKTAALQSVIDVISGKLPKSGDQLSKTVSNVGDEIKSNFGSKKSNKINENASINNVPLIDNQQQESSIIPISKENIINEQTVSQYSETQNSAEESTEGQPTTNEQNSQPIETE